MTYAEIDKAEVLKFVEALESGEYPQHTGDLIAENSSGELCYCAEGVFAKVVLKWEVNRDWEDPCSGDRYPVFIEPNGGIRVTGLRRRDWDNSPFPAGAEMVLPRMNDILKMSFSEIAQVIRETWLTD